MEKTKVAEALTMENKRSLLEAALRDRIGLSNDDHLWVEDMNETEVFYTHDYQAYKASYTIDLDGKVELGESEKVVRQVVYKSIEALQSVYSDLIQEAGKRNAMSDSSRIKKILELCQELLSSEKLDIDKVKRAIEKATDTLSWLKGNMPMMKIEDGIAYPIEAYAYTPDSDGPEDWKLRLFEGNKLSRFHLNKAAAFLSTGGYKGQYIQIAENDIFEVKRRIRTQYRTLGVSEGEIPRWVKEVETRELVTSYSPLLEAKFDKGRAAVIVIKPGFNATKDKYYPAEMLKRDYKIFEGQKMYADHPTEEEDKARPERSIRDWVATLKDVSVDETGIVTGIAEVHEGWLKAKLAALGEKNMLPEMGISINAIANVTRGKIDGKETLIIERLTAARSVDFVTEPGAGGVVTFYESDRSRDVDLIELSVFKEKRPDLVEALESGFRAKVTKEVKGIVEIEEKVKELEKKNKELTSQTATLTTENTDLKTKITEGEKEQAKAKAQAEIKKAVEEAESLPKASQGRLLKRFKDAETADGIKEAIKAELEYVAELSESGKVKGLGPTKNANSKTDEEALTEALKETNPNWSEEQLKVAVRG